MVISISPPLAIKWSKDLELGIDVIDEQHKTIIDYINDLYTARFNNDIGGIRSVFNLIIEFTQYHFALEEDLMLRSNFSEFEAHKKIHQKMVDELNGYALRFLQGEDTSGLLQTMMMNWLIGHIKQDAKYVTDVKKLLNKDVKTVCMLGPWKGCVVCERIQKTIFFVKRIFKK